MRDKFKKITDNMKNFGCSLIGKAAYEATFFENFENAHSSAVVTAAHGAEIILKSCIASEHPLLIFEKIPKIDFKKNFIEDLVEKGKSVRYFDLPDLLQLATGYEIKNRTDFENFGKLRNKIIHLGYHGSSEDTIKFLIEIVEPIINKFWNATVFEQVNGNFDSEAIYYFIEQCVEIKSSGRLNFKLSEVAQELFNEDDKKYLVNNFQINLDDHI